MYVYIYKIIIIVVVIISIFVVVIVSLDMLKTEVDFFQVSLINRKFRRTASI